MAHDERRFLVAGKRLESLLKDEKLRSRSGITEAEVVPAREVNVITGGQGMAAAAQFATAGSSEDIDDVFNGASVASALTGSRPA